MRSAISLMFLGACVLLFASCGSSRYHKEYRRAAAATKPPYTNLEGAWKGTWSSLGSGHKGKLKCYVVGTGKPDRSNFHYWANWARVFSGTYVVPKSGEKTRDGTYLLTGENDLDPFGHFSYKATATAEEISATYKSTKGDHGVFELKRP